MRRLYIWPCRGARGSALMLHSRGLTGPEAPLRLWKRPPWTGLPDLGAPGGVVPTCAGLSSAFSLDPNDLSFASFAIRGVDSLISDVWTPEL